MSKKFLLIGLIAIFALAFVVVQCSRDQQNPVTPIQTTAKIQVDGTDPLAPVVPTCADNDPSSPVGIVPTRIEGNTPKENEYLVKIDPPNAGTYALGTGSVTISFSTGPCGQVMTWSITDNIVIDSVYAKGGPAYNEYDYTGVYPRRTTDGNIHCPVGPSGKYADFSHVNFVFHYKLTVNKTAVPEYTRTYYWIIDKVGDQTDLTLAAGETYTVNYDVKVDATYTDSDWKVTGTITIFNNTPLAAVITSITDVAGGVTATVDCALPYTLAAGATLNCTYVADLTGAVNGTNKVTVVTSTPKVEGGTATKDYTFGDPTTYTDECIDVTDDQYGALGTVCYANLPKAFEYSLTVGPYTECDMIYYFKNIASFITNDTETTSSDSWTVTVTIPPCNMGCTLTIGYWKTHAGFTGNNADMVTQYLPIWLGTAGGAKSVQVTTAAQAVTILSTMGSNGIDKLKAQLLGAKLNIANGAAPTAVAATIAAADAFLAMYNSASWSKLSKANQQMVLGWMTILDNYNNGLIGPGHCSE